MTWRQSHQRLTENKDGEHCQKRHLEAHIIERQRTGYQHHDSRKCQGINRHFVTMPQRQQGIDGEHRSRTDDTSGHPYEKDKRPDAEYDEHL